MDNLASFDESRLDKSSQILIVEEGEGVGTVVAERLMSLGLKVSILDVSSTENARVDEKGGIPRTQLSTVTDLEVKNYLDAIVIHKGPISGIIHVNPRSEKRTDPTEFCTVVQTNTLKTIFLIAKHLRRCFLTELPVSRSFFMVISRIDGQFGQSNSGFASLIQKAYFGLTKSLDREWDSVYCRAVDLHPDLDTSIASTAILEELTDSKVLPLEVSRDKHNRRHSVTNIEMPISPSNIDKSGISSESVFLVSGGGRGITAACVKAVAKKYKCKFILVGRTDISVTEPEWASKCMDKVSLKSTCVSHYQQIQESVRPKDIERTISSILAVREVKDTLHMVEDLGGESIYINADLTDKESLKSQILSLPHSYKSISGVIHGCGELADKKIENKTLTDFNKVFGPKVQGLDSLLSVVAVEKLTHFLLFSSISAVYGKEGQTDYSLSNEVLNSFACQMQHSYPQCLVRAINWGPWDGGMVTELLKNKYEAQGIDVISEREGTAKFVLELQEGPSESPQVIISPSKLDDYVRSKSKSTA